MATPDRKTFTIQIPQRTLQWLSDRYPNELERLRHSAMNRAIVEDEKLQLCGVPEGVAVNIIRIVNKG